MDVNITDRRGQVMEKVEEAFFEKLGQAMEYSRETLYDIMLDYAVEGDGYIEARDLPKVIKKLGIMNPDPHLHHVLQAGGCGPNDTRIDIHRFARNLEAEIAKRHKVAASVYERQLQKIAAILKAKDISLFEFFVMLFNLICDSQDLADGIGIRGFRGIQFLKEFDGVVHKLLVSWRRR